MRMPDARPVSDTQDRTTPLPPDGWTKPQQAKFLSLLAEKGNVRHCAARCGLSAQSAYKLRRRDARFARAWRAAVLLAREHAEQVMADRALDGIEEPVFYRGEQVGVRRRYDNRLLLAHMARLDRLADEAAARGDAGRFDELLALVAGEDLPAALASDADLDLPPPRDAHAEALARAAEQSRRAASPRARNKAEEAELTASIRAAGDAARTEAAAHWDAWFARACARVDGLDRVPQPLHRLPGTPLLRQPRLKAWTVSTVSTAALAGGVANGLAGQGFPRTG